MCEFHKIVWDCDVSVYPHRAANSAQTISLTPAKKTRMQWHLRVRGHLLNHCWPQRDAVSSPTIPRLGLLVFRQEYFGGTGLKPAAAVSESTVWRCWAEFRSDVILAEGSPSSQKSGLVHVWGGGWEGPLTATPPCPPAPHRSRSPGRGSEEEEFTVRWRGS